jgi:hypothetical protein
MIPSRLRRTVPIDREFPIFCYSNRHATSFAIEFTRPIGTIFVYTDGHPSGESAGSMTNFPNKSAKTLHSTIFVFYLSNPSGTTTLNLSKPSRFND